MDPDDPMMSCLPSGQSSRGGETLPWTQSHGSSGTVSSFDPLARAADLLNTNFLDLETLLLGLSELESRRSCQDNPSRSLGGGGGVGGGGGGGGGGVGGVGGVVGGGGVGGGGWGGFGGGGGGGRTYVRTYGHFFRLKGRGVFPGN